MIGLSNFLISYGMFTAIVWLFGRSALSAGLGQSVSYSAGIVWSYFWNRSWTFSFDSGGSHLFFRFVLLQIGIMAASSFMISFGAAYFGSSLSKVWFSVMIPMTFLNFFGMKYFIFRRAHR